MIAKAPRKTPRKNRFAQVPQLQNFPWWAAIQRIDLADKLTPYPPPPVFLEESNIGFPCFSHGFSH